jgi:hypothetical protein
MLDVKQSDFVRFTKLVLNLWNPISAQRLAYQQRSNTGYLRALVGLHKCGYNDNSRHCITET